MQTICFIVNVLNSEDLNGLLDNLNLLHIPNGFECEVSLIENAKNKSCAFEEGRVNSNAKYKIYLDTNTRIRQLNFLYEYIDIFQKNSDVGVIDVAGNTVFPADTQYIFTSKRVGKIVVDNSTELRGEDFSEPFKEVVTVDGWLMATQYDIPWCGDVYTGDGYIAASQSIEYKKQGYKCVVVNQQEPWVVTMQKTDGCNDADKDIFLSKYSNDIYPKVLIIITTYNRPGYLQEALKSAMNQTYKNLEIVISDDSTNDDTEKIIGKYLEQDSRVKYYRQKGFSGRDNFIWCLRYVKQTDAEYINWLMDDDVIYENKIERMLKYYFEYESVSLVTSYRDIIDDNGDICEPGEAVKRIYDEDTVLVGEEAGKQMLINHWNYIGEFSTVLLRKSLLNEKYIFGWIDEKDFMLGLPDVSTWLQLLEKGNLAYISDALSATRVHSGQGQQNTAGYKWCLLHWLREIMYAKENNKYLDEYESYAALLKWLEYYISYMRIMLDTDLEETAELKGILVRAIDMLNNGLLNETGNIIPNYTFTEDDILTKDLPLTIES